MATKKKRSATAADVRARRTKDWVITLPQSELDVTVREVDVMDLAANGTIPDNLTQHVWDDLATLTDGKTNQERAEILKEHADMIAVVCCAMLVEPRMVLDDPDDGEITPTDLPYVDREFLHALACGQGRLADLHRFREEQERALEPASRRGDVRAATVSDPGVAGDVVGGVSA